jgi:aryl-alcohol dehydrogenase-like predicted oxidoreductase
MLCKWFQRTGKRDEIFLASKFGIVMDKMQFKGIDSSGEYCKRACEASLKRLGTDRIDLCEWHLSSQADSQRTAVKIYSFLSLILDQTTPIARIPRRRSRRQCGQWLS